MIGYYFSGIKPVSLCHKHHSPVPSMRLLAAAAGSVDDRHPLICFKIFF